LPRVHDLRMGEGTDAEDRERLRSAYLAHGGELLGFARQSLHDVQLAEEAVQETFARAWRSWASFDPGLGAIRAWLFAIERRVIIDISRQRSSRPTVPLEREPVADGDEIERAMMGWQVEAAIRRLRPQHRYVLVKTYFHQSSSQELAKELGIPEGTVRSRLFYALRSLRLILDELGWDW
jgi:RNA polymerase sigma-70 factor, ECF subfamily